MSSASFGLVFAGLSTEFCSGVLGFKSSVLMVSSYSEQVQTQPHEMSALDCTARFWHASSIEGSVWNGGGAGGAAYDCSSHDMQHTFTALGTQANATSRSAH